MLWHSISYIIQGNPQLQQVECRNVYIYRHTGLVLGQSPLCSLPSAEAGSTCTELEGRGQKDPLQISHLFCCAHADDPASCLQPLVLGAEQERESITLLRQGEKHACHQQKYSVSRSYDYNQIINNTVLWFALFYKKCSVLLSYWGTRTTKEAVICAEQPPWKSFGSGLENSRKYIRGYFNLSAVNQLLAASPNVLARIPDIASGAMVFVVMIWYDICPGASGQTPATRSV